MKVAIINFSGNTGKSTLTKNFLVPQIPNCKRISIEDLNEGDGKSEIDIGANMFRQVATELNVADDECNFAIDIGASAAKAMLAHFATLRTTRDDIDFWVVPVTPSIKQRADTINTVKALISIGVDPIKIIVIANNIVDTALFNGDFSMIQVAAKDLGFNMCSQAVLSNEVFEMTKGDVRSIFEISADATDLKALRKEYKGDPKKLDALGRRMVIRDCAEDACENLRTVFAATPIATALAELLTE